jgi:hypothetical protein
MSNDYRRKVPAARDKEPGFVKLTNKQLAVYYWFISKAYWNSERKDKYYFIYKSDICYAQIGRELGIKRPETIKRAMDKLEQYGRICITDDIVYIPHAELYTYLHIDLIKYLLAYSNILGAEIFLFYSVLKRVFELDKKNNEKTNFCVKLFVKLLGHNENDDNEYKKLKLYIAFLEDSGLIKTSRTIKVNKGGKYTEYTLWSIEKDLPLNLYIEENGEKIVNIDMEKLREYRKNIDFSTK